MNFDPPTPPSEQEVEPVTRYFTFGQTHVHSVNGITFDKDCVVKITAIDPRSIMVDHFGLKWSHEYDTPPNMEWYPRGIIWL